VTDARARRLSPPLRRALPWLVAALLVATFGLPTAAALGALPSAPAIGYSHAEKGNTTATLNMTDAPAFSPRSLNGSAGSTLSVHLVNQGAYPHSFTLSKVPNVVLNPSWTPARLDSFFAENGSLANVSVAPGSSSWANVSFNSSVGGDSFEFVSTVPYQFQAGMWGFVNLTASGPGLLLMDNTTDSYSFVPAVLAANTSHYPLVIDVLVTNTGNLGHTFTVAGQTNVTLSPATFTTYFAQFPPLVNAPVPGGAGSTVWANFTVPGPGVYQYICTVSGHFANGMTGFLYVGVAPPPQAAPPSTAVVESWVLVGSGVLLAFGILAATFATLAGRFPSAPKDGSKHH